MNLVELLPIQFTRVAATGENGSVVAIVSTDMFVTSGIIVPISTNGGAVSLGVVNTSGVTDAREENTSIVLPAVPGRVYNLKRYYMNAATEGDGVLVFGHLA